jgi:pimeloyl-ACP methyl ester carboxylesterase
MTDNCLRTRVTLTRKSAWNNFFMTRPAQTEAHAVQRPDGAEIHWQAQGDGPLVVLVHHTLWSHPGLYANLLTDLARDHRTVVYDPRGCGRSSRHGPYALETDADDLLAVVEAAGEGAVAIAIGDGFNRTARVATARPDLVSHVVAIAPSPAAFLPRVELEGSEILAASDSVMDMLMQLMATDPRAALRTMVAAVNPDLSEDELRKRLDYVADYLEAEASLERAHLFLHDDVGAQVRMLGNRLLILYGGVDPLFEGALGARVVELYPDARIEQVEDGPVSRPELTAEWVRRLSGVAAE